MFRHNIILLFLTTTLAGCSFDWEERRYSGTLKGVDICVEKNQSELVSAITIRNRCAKKHATEILILEPFDLSDDGFWFDFEWYGERIRGYKFEISRNELISYFAKEFRSSSIILVDVELTHTSLDKDGNYASASASPIHPLWIEPNSSKKYDYEIEFRFGEYAPTKMPASCTSDLMKCTGVRLTKYSVLNIIPSD